MYETAIRDDYTSEIIKRNDSTRRLDKAVTRLDIKRKSTNIYIYIYIQKWIFNTGILGFKNKVHAFWML